MSYMLFYFNLRDYLHYYNIYFNTFKNSMEKKTLNKKRWTGQAKKKKTKERWKIIKQNLLILNEYGLVRAILYYMNNISVTVFQFVLYN